MKRLTLPLVLASALLVLESPQASVEFLRQHGHIRLGEHGVVVAGDVSI